MRVLVVDDDRAVRDSLRRSLEFNDFEAQLLSPICESWGKARIELPLAKRTGPTATPAPPQ